MTLIVEDGTGLADAESYATVEYATAYHAKFGNTDWALASEPEQEVALRKGAQYLDLTWKKRWKSTRANEDQALDHPRLAYCDDDGFVVESTDMPTPLLDANCEAGLLALSEDLLPDIDEPGTIEAESVKVGPIEESFQYAGGKSQTKQYTKIDRLIAPLIDAGGNLYRS